MKTLKAIGTALLVLILIAAAVVFTLKHLAVYFGWGLLA